MSAQIVGREFARAKATIGRNPPTPARALRVCSQFFAAAAAAGGLPRMAVSQGDRDRVVGLAADLRPISLRGQDYWPMYC